MNAIRPTIAVTAACAIACSTNAQLVQVDYDEPSLDRWMYPFAGDGTETRAPTFGAIEIPGFDDRDSQFLIGFNTGADIPTGLGADAYYVRRVRVTTSVQSVDQFRYDPTFDSIYSLLQQTDPDYVPDADPGRPVEIFGVGFRNGWSAATWSEGSPFGGPPAVPPSEGARNAFAAIVDTNGAATDISRQVRQRFDAAPWSIGQCDVPAGSLVPQGTEMTFDVDLCDPAVRAYFERAANSGRVLLIVSSLEPAQGGPDGGSGAYPVFFTKENPLSEPLGYSATLEFDVLVGSRADFNGDGFINGDDFDAYVEAFEAGDAIADVDGDCFVSGDDFDLFVVLFERG